MLLKQRGGFSLDIETMMTSVKQCRTELVLATTTVNTRLPLSGLQIFVENINSMITSPSSSEISILNITIVAPKASASTRASSYLDWEDGDPLCGQCLDVPSHRVETSFYMEDSRMKYH